jgi:REP element-mobilizing transposase RayT
MNYLCPIQVRRKPKQLPLEYRTHGGKREGAGRPRGPRPNVRHRRRPALAPRHPIHVTLRLRRELGSLRRRTVYSAFWSAWVRLRRELGLRLVHYSIQHDHIHLIVEIDDRASLSRGMQGLAIRTARALNRTLRRSGRVFADRFHARALTTPREVRNALVYVLNNKRHHAHDRGVQLGPGFDPYSSAVWFAGWKEGPQRWPKPIPRPPPVVPATTWLLRSGWARHAAPSFGEIPGGR